MNQVLGAEKPVTVILLKWALQQVIDYKRLEL